MALTLDQARTVKKSLVEVFNQASLEEGKSDDVAFGIAGTAEEGYCIAVRTRGERELTTGEMQLIKNHARPYIGRALQDNEVKVRIGGRPSIFSNRTA